MANFWDFVVRPPFGPTPTPRKAHGKTTVNWFIPPGGKNSGGHINLFRFALGLEQRGFECRAVITYDGTIVEQPALEVATAEIEEWYGHLSGGVHFMSGDVPPADITIATGWQSAYGVHAFRGSDLKYYFIQDYEPWFYAQSSESVFAESTYRLGLIGLTAGSWLSDLVSSRYGMKAHALSFSYDRELYKPCPRRVDGVRRVFSYVRPETPRRGWELTQLAIKRLHEMMPDVRFVLAGGYVPPDTFDFPVFSPGSVPLDQLAGLYSQCDCALVISLTNLSLLPVELMGCGVPVVSNKGPNVEWLMSNGNAKLCDPSPEKLAIGMKEILELSPRELARLRDKSIEFAHETSWTKQFDRLSLILNKYLERDLAENQ